VNTFHPITFAPSAHSRRATTERPASARPERDFGVGYGRSSGYTTTRRYASNWAPPRFRFA
jgi:hypothetical protein